MARDQLRAPLRQNFYALEEDLARGNRGPLSRHDGGTRAVGDDELEGEGLDDLNRARRDPDIAETAAEDTCGGRCGRKDAVLHVLVKHELARLRVANAHPIGMCDGTVGVEGLWVNRNTRMRRGS